MKIFLKRVGAVLLWSPIFPSACEVCQTMPPGSCALHRQPTQPLTDRRVSYAVKSLPPECKFGVSYSAGEGCGVYTNQPIPTGTWIGPFEGRRIRPSDVTSEMDTSHMWEVNWNRKYENACELEPYLALLKDSSQLLPKEKEQWWEIHCKKAKCRRLTTTVIQPNWFGKSYIKTLFSSRKQDQDLLGEVESFPTG